jgi:hypothetical protein
MIETLTLEQAIEKCPAINAAAPAAKASSRYSFISTRQILDKALENDWIINKASQGRGGSTGQHRISLVHKSQLDQPITEGYPQINITNSHDLSKRFSVALGFFRLVCSNGLIAPVGMCSSLQPTIHRQKEGSNFSDLLPLLQASFADYSSITSRIDDMKNRQLSSEERNALARYAYYIRFRYRMSQPKKFDVQEALKPRREADTGNDLWKTFNTIQENIVRGGGTTLGKGITQFQDDTRFNQELWLGVDKALTHSGRDLDVTLKNLFPKKERPRKETLLINN